MGVRRGGGGREESSRVGWGGVEKQIKKRRKQLVGTVQLKWQARNQIIDLEALSA